MAEEGEVVDLGDPNPDWKTLVDEEKYEYLAKNGFYKLKDAKQSDTGTEVNLYFSCLKCLPQKNTYSTQVSSVVGNLRRHLKRKHSASLSEFNSVVEQKKQKISDTSEKGPSLSTPSVKQWDKLKSQSARTVTQQQVDDLVTNFVVKVGFCAFCLKVYSPFFKFSMLTPLLLHVRTSTINHTNLHIPANPHNFTNAKIKLPSLIFIFSFVVRTTLSKK